MKSISTDSVDCIVTDPPYGLNFMGKEWDKALPPKTAFVEMLRVLKPGALAFVMSSPRQDLEWRMAQLLEESGFELGQSFISWVYASGFPKAYDLPLGIDLKFIREEFESENGRQPTREELKSLLEERRKVVGHYKIPSDSTSGRAGKSYNHGENAWVNELGDRMTSISEPTYDEAKKWSGWKAVSGLKPALEVIFMVQKPLSEKTIVDNVLRWGTGAMNVDAARIPIERGDDSAHYGGLHETRVGYGGGFSEGFRTEEKAGRFPANLLVSDDALDDGKITKDTLHLKSKVGALKFTGQDFNNGEIYKTKINQFGGYTDSGQFSRYFNLDAWARHHGFLNVPKAGTGEREYGLYGLEKKEVIHAGHGNQEEDDVTKRFRTNRRNTHPTVKPVELMAYLIELGCPRGGVVLDPFVGSGTTCIAAKQLRRRYIGIEIDPETHRIAVKRVASYSVNLDEWAKKN